MWIPTLFNLALQKVIQSIKMVPSGIKIDKQQLNVLAYVDDIVLTFWRRNLAAVRLFKGPTARPL